ncbi:MAG TPA: XRE family transcriptional regulator [Longimicrobium sp.]|jgi:transcriptional regulator with XRE-family HTH domain
MAGHKPWREILEQRHTPEEIAQIKGWAERMSAGIALNELRQARGLTQEELACRLETGQPSVSRLERRRDVRLSTLREVVEAMGGELKVVAHFPDADYLIDAFEPRFADAAD